MTERTIKQSDIRPKFLTSVTHFDRDPIYTDPGVTEESEMVERINPNTLEPEYVPTGKVRNLVDLHQQDAESCDINLLMKRYQIGDINAIRQIEEVFYGDSTEYPTDSLTAANLVLAAQQMFDMLPLDVKQSFDNNYQKWMAKVQANDMDTLVKSGLAHHLDAHIIDKPEPKGDDKE